MNKKIILTSLLATSLVVPATITHNAEATSQTGNVEKVNFKVATAQLPDVSQDTLNALTTGGFKYNGIGFDQTYAEVVKAQGKFNKTEKFNKKNSTTVVGYYGKNNELVLEFAKNKKNAKVDDLTLKHMTFVTEGQNFTQQAIENYAGKGKVVDSGEGFLIKDYGKNLTVHYEKVNNQFVAYTVTEHFTGK
ncbi:hypothetical protein ACMGE6_02290 [Macrococcus equi]|uniref:hypothetical protein n=1 Tax=Macrococcus equi TaxID=3395462 RepID=UPI0039BE8301